MEQTKSKNTPKKAVSAFMDAWISGDWRGMVKYCRPVYLHAYQKAGLKPEQALYARLYWGTYFESVRDIQLADTDNDWPQKIEVQEIYDIDPVVEKYAFVTLKAGDDSYMLIVGLELDNQEWKVHPTLIFRPVIKN